MSKEQFIAFAKTVETNKELQEQLTCVASTEEVLTIANDMGFEITMADLYKVQAEEILELSDDEILSVSAGMKRGAKLGLIYGAAGASGIAAGAGALYGLLWLTMIK